MVLNVLSVGVCGYGSSIHGAVHVHVPGDGGGGLPEDEEEAEDSLSDVRQRSEEV